MGAARSPERDRSYEIYKAAGGEGKMTNRAIAEQLGVPEGTVNGWKTKDKWKQKLQAELEAESGDSNGVLQSNERSTPMDSAEYSNQADPKSRSPDGKRNREKKGKKQGPGAPIGNQHAKGHGAPEGNDNALGNDGGAPVGNENALKTGRYQQIMYDTLDDEERELWDLIPTDPVQKIDEQIRKLSLLARRIDKNYQRFMNGLPEKQRLEISELRDVKVEEVATNGKKIKVPKKELVVVQVQETEPRKVETAMMFWKHMADVEKELTKAIQVKESIVGNSEKLTIAKERWSIDKQKLNGPKNNQAEDWVSALEEVAAKRRAQKEQGELS